MISAVSSDARWSLPRIVAYVVLIAVVFFASQILATIVALLVRASIEPGLDMEKWLAEAESNGGVLVAATLTSTTLSVPFIRFLVGRREVAPWRFLRFQSVSLRSLVSWSAALIALVAATDLITDAIGRPIVVDFMLEAYLSASPVMLFFALVVAAPIFEEIFFRGFLVSALEARGVSLLVAAVVSSGLWAAIHVQYDFYGIATIFLMGLLLAAARARTGSLYPCFAMHGLANAIAFAETAFVARVGGA